MRVRTTHLCAKHLDCTVVFVQACAVVHLSVFVVILHVLQFHYLPGGYVRGRRSGLEDELHALRTRPVL
jgi:hypothetical protein